MHIEHSKQSLLVDNYSKTQSYMGVFVCGVLGFFDIWGVKRLRLSLSIHGRTC